VAEHREPLAELDEKMEDAAEAARYKYDHPIRYKLKRALFAALKAIAILVGIVVAAIVAIVLIVVGIISGAIWLVVIGVIILTAIVGFVVYGIVSGIYHRIKSATTVGEGIGGFFLGILDITGIPNIIEGITEKDLVNGRQLTLDEAGDRLGGGVVALLTLVIPFVKGLKGARGARGVPIEAAPEVAPVVPESPAPVIEPVGKARAPVVEPLGKAPASPVEPIGKSPAPTVEAPKVEPPKVETPRAEPPRAEPPRAEPPKARPSQVEPAAPEAAKPETPAARTPVPEEPKVAPATPEPAPGKGPKAELPEPEGAKGKPKAEAKVPKAETDPIKAADESTAKLGEEPELDIEQPTRTPPQKTVHWKDVEPFIGKDIANGPPPGYRVFFRNGKTFIRRLVANDKEFPRLTIENGKIKIGKPGSTRISKPGALAKSLGERPPEHQAHHAVPDDVVKSEPLFEEARKHGYDLDRARNGTYLPETASARAQVPASAKLPLHSGSHPVYNSLAREFTQRVLADLLEEFPGSKLSEIPAEQILEAAAVIEDLMQDALQKWTTTHGDKLR
jgi:hypothetical protein